MRLPCPLESWFTPRDERKLVGQQGTIQVEIHSADAAIVTLRGEHDLESRQRVTAALTAAAVCPNVVVDLSGCTFVDSSLIVALLCGARTLGERGGTLPLVVGRDARSVRRTLDLMGIVNILPLHDSRAAALGALASGPRGSALHRAA
jgi:anti-anti-sigma factor